VKRVAGGSGRGRGKEAGGRGSGRIIISEFRHAIFIK